MIRARAVLGGLWLSWLIACAPQGPLTGPMLVHERGAELEALAMRVARDGPRDRPLIKAFQWGGLQWGQTTITREGGGYVVASGPRRSTVASLDLAAKLAGTTDATLRWFQTEMTSLGIVSAEPRDGAVFLGMDGTNGTLVFVPDGSDTLRRLTDAARAGTLAGEFVEFSHIRGPWFYGRDD